jgi:two-component system, sensor histidine kinase LadS
MKSTQPTFYLLIFIYLLVLLPKPTWAQKTIDTLKLGSMPKEFDLFLPSYIEAIEDKNDKFKIQDFIRDTSFHFIKPKVEGHLGINPSAWWIRFKVVNNTDSDQTLLIDYQNVFMNQVTLYVVDDSSQNILKTVELGSDYPFDKRTLLTRNFVFDHGPFKNKTYTYYLYLNNRGEPISLPLFLVTPSAFAERETRFVAIFSLTAGILLTMSLVSLYIFINYKQKPFLYYSIFTLSDLAWAACNYGFAYQWLWTEQPLWNENSPNFFALCSSIAFIPFLKSFFFSNVKPSKLLVYFFNVSAGIGLFNGIYFVLASTKLLPPSTTMLNFILFYLLVNFILYTYIILRATYQNLTHANLCFAFGFSFMIFGAMVNLWREMVALPVGFFTEHICMLGLYVEVFFTGYAMSININTLLKHRENLIIEKSNYQDTLLRAEIQASEEERKRIASDLHDEIGMMLTSAKMVVVQSFQKEEAIVLIDKSISKIREITHQLHPSVVDQFGLKAALEETLETTALSVAFNLDFEIGTFKIHKKDVQINIYRIVLELLNNTIKHAHAKNVYLKISEVAEKTLCIEISDDGIGFDTETVVKGIGLNNIKSRIQVMNGVYEINTSPNEGCKTVLQIPI